MLQPFLDPGQISAGGVQRQRRVRRAQHQVAAMPSRQVDHHVDLGRPDSIDHLAIQHRITRLIGLVVEPLAEEIGTRDESLEMAAQALWSGVHGICILTLTNKLHLVGRQRTEQLIDSLVTHYIAGVRAA